MISLRLDRVLFNRSLAAIPCERLCVTTVKLVSIGGPHRVCNLPALPLRSAERLRLSVNPTILSRLRRRTHVSRHLIFRPLPAAQPHCGEADRKGAAFPHYTAAKPHARNPFGAAADSPGTAPHDGHFAIQIHTVCTSGAAALWTDRSERRSLSALHCGKAARKKSFPVRQSRTKEFIHFNFSRSLSFTIFGLALPFEAFIT